MVRHCLAGTAAGCGAAAAAVRVRDCSVIVRSEAAGAASGGGTANQATVAGYIPDGAAGPVEMIDTP